MASSGKGTFQPVSLFVLTKRLYIIPQMLQFFIIILVFRFLGFGCSHFLRRSTENKQICSVERQSRRSKRWVESETEWYEKSRGSCRGTEPCRRHWEDSVPRWRSIYITEFRGYFGKYPDAWVTLLL